MYITDRQVTVSRSMIDTETRYQWIKTEKQIISETLFQVNHLTQHNTEETKLNTIQGNCTYHTSSTLYNPTTPSRLISHIACAQKFSQYYLRLPHIVNDPFCCMMLLVIEWSRCSERDSTAAATIANTFEWPGQTLKNAPYPWGICTPI